MSVDSHVDMSSLPGDLFVENAPQHLKNKVPLILETRDGPRWVAEDNILGVAIKYPQLSFWFHSCNYRIEYDILNFL